MQVEAMSVRSTVDAQVTVDADAGKGQSIIKAFYDRRSQRRNDDERSRT